MMNKEAEENKARAIISKELSTGLRPYPAIKKFLSSEVNLHNFLSVVFEISKSLKPEEKSKVDEWIKFAEDDLFAYEMLYGAKRYGLALYHLQQTVEKLVKANAIFFGIKKEKDLYKYQHSPAKFFVEFLESELIKKIRENNPLNVKIELLEHNKIELLKKLAEDRLRKDDDMKAIKEILEMDEKGLPSYIKFLNSISFPLLSVEGTEELSECVKKKISKSPKELRGEIRKIGKRIDIEKVTENAIIQIQHAIGISLLLAPLSFLTPIFESVGRYPDEKRIFTEDYGKDYEDINLLKYSDDLIPMLKKYIKIMRRV